MKGIRIKDETGCCSCLFVVVGFWLVLIVAVGGYKLFMYILNL